MITDSDDFEKLTLQDPFFLFELQSPGTILMTMHSVPIPTGSLKSNSPARRLFLSNHDRNNSDLTDKLRPKALKEHILDVDALLDEVVSDLH